MILGEIRPFKFQQFHIIQSDDVFKVGTDAVLLGSNLRLNECFTALEVGCGTGVISLIAAQRFPHSPDHCNRLFAAGSRFGQGKFSSKPLGTKVDCPAN